MEVTLFMGGVPNFCVCHFYASDVPYGGHRVLVKFGKIFKIHASPIFLYIVVCSEFSPAHNVACILVFYSVARASVIPLSC